MPKSSARFPLSSARPALGLLLTGLLAACGPGAPGPVPPVDKPPPIDEPQPSFNLPADGLKINFQPADFTAPSGYTADTGAAYNDARGYGWVTQDGHTPLDVSVNARAYDLPGVEARLKTFIHMQYNANNSAPAVRTAAAWEYKIPDGTYTVTVSTGDPSTNLDSKHALSIEGQKAILPYLPADTSKFRTITRRVAVSDGRLTIDAIGGTNTKINYVIIAPGDRPSVRDTDPENGQTAVAPNESVTVDVNLPGGAIELDSLKSQNAAYLTEQGSGARVAAQVTTSGGGDAVILKPLAPLKSNTAYTFQVTGELKDVAGNSFLPFHTTFVTGSPTTSGGNVAFEQVPQGIFKNQNGTPQYDYPYTSVEVGPDGKLYAATLTGEILRFGMQPDGTLTTPQIITSVRDFTNGVKNSVPIPRTIIGLKFDPASTADNLILWISNNYYWNGTQQAPEWSGKITRLSDPNLETVQDYVTGLPRSIRDHETNSISFKPGEQGALYVLQGSDSSTGAPDPVWGNRPEKLLNAALLRVDVSRITPGSPVDVKTADGGTYNPYVTGAPVTLYATGIRNAYDMVWHTNGFLYVPTNGAAASGNTPSTPADLPASCNNRPDGPYTGPAVVGNNNLGTQNDYLFRVLKGKYYGHPNPERCEWVLNGGNPTAGQDPAEVPEYAVGTQPDRNWGGFAYDFGPHASANGVIEEYKGVGNSLLKNRLLVVRYSKGKDIIVLTPGPDGNIINAQAKIEGLGNFNPSPLDLTEDRSNGNLYVAQLDEQTGKGTITLVRPK